MSINVEIVPTADCVAMVGDVNTFTSYSLSGNVIVKYEKSLVRSLLPMLQPLYYTIVSLDVYFEGHQDILDRTGGLASTSICKLKKNLLAAGSMPIVVSPLVHTLGIPFEIAVPSWLPPTWMGADGATSYALFCKARLLPHFAPCDLLVPYKPSTVELGNIYPLAEEVSGRRLTKMRSLWCLGRPVQTPSAKCVDAKPVSIAVGRFRTPPTQLDIPGERHPSLFPYTYYVLEPKLQTTPEMLGDQLQMSLFNSLVLHVGVPSFVGVQEKKVPLYVAVKSNMSKDALAEQKFEVAKVSFNIQQVESYQTPICSDYLANHPLPPADQQPPKMPLMSENILTSLGACGLLTSSNSESKWERHNELSKHDVEHTFNHELSQGHCKTRLDIPIVQEEKGKETVTIWPDMESPYCRMHHCVFLSIECRYVNEQGEARTEQMSGVVPLRFTAVSTHRSSAPVSPSFTVPNMDCPKPKVPKQGSPTTNFPPVPAYGQLFDENGETRMADALPVYEPKKSLDIQRRSNEHEAPAFSTLRTSTESCRTSVEAHQQPRRHRPMAIAI